MVTTAQEPTLTPDQYEFWSAELENAKKDRSKRFSTEARRALTAYNSGSGEEGGHGTPLAMFWANVQVMQGILYANPPKADVSRRHKTYGDDKARVAGTILERIINAGIESDADSFEDAWRKSVWDWLVPGLGQVWLRYVPSFEDIMDESGQPVMLEDGKVAQRISDEDATTEYVNWCDLYWSPAKTWAEVTWIGRAVHMSRDALTKRFGEEIAPLLSYSRKRDKDNEKSGKDDVLYGETARIIEIWYKPTRTVYWICDGYDSILDSRVDPLQLRGFFPAPEPLAMNLTTEHFMPTPLYVTAEPLYTQIDEISSRIKWLTRACKIAGVRDQNVKEFETLFKRAELSLVPVENWAALSEKGGIRGAMELVNIEMISSTIEKLRFEKAARVNELYEVLGLSDILRGQAQKVETATTQGLKAKYGESRVGVYAQQLEMWVSQVLSLRAEIMVKHFQPETLIRRSGIMETPDKGLAMAAVESMKSDRDFQWRVKVQSASMAAPDWQGEQQARVEFMKGFQGMLQGMGPVVQQMPQSMPFFLEILKWILSGFRASKEIESVLDSAIDTMRSQPQKPNPAQQAELQLTQAKAASEKADAMATMREAMMPPQQPGPMQ